MCGGGQTGAGVVTGFDVATNNKTGEDNG